MSIALHVVQRWPVAPEEEDKNKARPRTLRQHPITIAPEHIRAPASSSPAYTRVLYTVPSLVFHYYLLSANL